MSSLTDPLPAPQAEPPTRERESPSSLETEWGEKMASSGRIEIRQRGRRQRSTSPSNPSTSSGENDPFRFPAILSSQAPPPPPWPEQNLDGRLIDDLLINDNEYLLGQRADIASARAAQIDSLPPDKREELMPVVKGKGKRIATDAVALPPQHRHPEVDQLPASLIDRLWFGVEPERKLTESPKPVLNKDRGKSKLFPIWGLPKPQPMTLKRESASVEDGQREPRTVDGTGYHASMDTVNQAQPLLLEIGKRDDRISTSSTKTHDSGYESAFNMFDEIDDMILPELLRKPPLGAWETSPFPAPKSSARDKTPLRRPRQRETTPTKRPSYGKWEIPETQLPETSGKQAPKQLGGWIKGKPNKVDARGFTGRIRGAPRTPSSPKPVQRKDKDIESRDVKEKIRRRILELTERTSEEYSRPRIQTPCADPDGLSSPPVASDVSLSETETPPEAPINDTSDFPETPETPACSSVGNDEAGVGSASDGETPPRSPSPWQQADDEDASLRLAIALSQITRGMSEMLSSQGSTRGSLDSSRTASPETAPVDGCRHHVGGAGGAGGTSPGGPSYPAASPAATDSNGRSVAYSRAGDAITSRRKGGGSNGDSDDEDGNEPNPKRRKPGTPEQAVARRRFACPYQKHDPLGSPFCCAKTSKNQEGGAENFSRVKSHILRNHDPFIRCDICWKMCRTEKGVLEHKENEDCISKPSPAKYWMTREERNQVQRRRFTSGQVENWFSLFGILCPNVPADGPNGYKTRISPYFMDPDQKFSLDSYAPWPSHQPVPSRPDQDLHPTAPRRRQSPNSIPCQPLAGHVQNGQEAMMDFSSLLEIPEADFTMDEPLPFDNTNLIFKRDTFSPPNSLLGNGSQPEPFPGPTPVLLVDQPVAPPDHGHPSVGPTGTTNPSSNFLQLDNARLRNSNKQLADEVQSIGKQCSEAQAQLRGLRDELRQLGNSLEGLLYEPSVQSGDREVMGRLFEISNTVTGISKSLGSGT